MLTNFCSIFLLVLRLNSRFSLLFCLLLLLFCRELQISHDSECTWYSGMSPAMGGGGGQDFVVAPRETFYV